MSAEELLQRCVPATLGLFRRHGVSGLGVVVLLAAVAACAGGASVKAARSGAATSSATLAPTPSPTPSFVPATSTAATTVPGSPYLPAELLTLKSFPAGWSSPDSTGSRLSNRGCLAVLTASGGWIRRAEARFQGGTKNSEFVDEVLESFAAGGAGDEVAHYREVLAMCTQLGVTLNGIDFTGTVNAISFPRVGDDSAAYRLELTATAGKAQVTLGYGLVVARRADTVMVLVVSSIDPAYLDQLQQATAVAAMAKVR